MCNHYRGTATLNLDHFDPLGVALKALRGFYHCSVARAAFENQITFEKTEVVLLSITSATKIYSFKNSVSLFF